MCQKTLRLGILNLLPCLCCIYLSLTAFVIGLEFFFISEPVKNNCLLLFHQHSNIWQISELISCGVPWDICNPNIPMCLFLQISLLVVNLVVLNKPWTLFVYSQEHYWSEFIVLREILILYLLADFEDFNIPEEHRISHNCLAGLSLFFLEKEGALMEKVLNKVHSPMKWPSLPKLSGM